jgi:hypothetical protein
MKSAVNQAVITQGEHFGAVSELHFESWPVERL